MKNSTEKEDLKGSSWKVFHQLENLLTLALNYRKGTVVDQHVIITHWKKEGQVLSAVKEDFDAAILLVLAALVGLAVVEEEQLELFVHWS